MRSGKDRNTIYYIHSWKILDRGYGGRVAIQPGADEGPPASLEKNLFLPVS